MSIRYPKRRGEFNKGILYKYNEDIVDETTGEVDHELVVKINYDRPFLFRFSYSSGTSRSSDNGGTEERFNHIQPGFNSNKLDATIYSTANLKFKVGEIIEFGDEELLIITKVTPFPMNNVRNLRGQRQYEYKIELSK